MALRRVRLTEPGLAGIYVVVEQRADGCLLLRPETVDEVVDELADRRLTEAQQEDAFGRLDQAAERQVDAPGEPDL